MAAKKSRENSPVAEGMTGEVDRSKIPAEILQEIEIFEGEVQRLKREEITADQFKGFRLMHGVYGQRQPGVQMVRIKIPQGRLNPTQLRRIADISETYTSGILHIATRQNIQIHFAKLENTSKMMLRLAEVGLTTREACGDTVRNITACPLAGVSPDEAFDVTPYGLALTRYFLRNPICQKLPRKFKIALEGCQNHDHVATFIHDIGITARREGERVGFKITIGGGLGSTPKTAKVLTEFAPPEDLVAICEAAIRVFDRHGPRQNRYKARMKFLVEKMGFEKFHQMWKTEFDLIKSQNGHYTLPAVEEAPTHQPGAPRTWHREEASGPLGEWLRTNVMKQKQTGFNLVTVKVPLGDFNVAQARAMADACEKFSDDAIRTTVQQNLVLRWIHEEDLPALYDHLVQAGLADAGAEGIENIIACPGTDTCSLSLTSSKGLTRSLEELFPPDRPVHHDLAGMSIKISGCQNACAQHQLASIGFHGVGKKVAGHSSPFYEIFLGGTNQQVAKKIIKIPAKRAVDMVKHLMEWYRSERSEGEPFEAFATRMGAAKLKQGLMPFTFLPSYEEDRNFYVDWGEDKDFSTEDLGPGECASGAYELMEGFMFEADQEIYLAKVMADKGLTGHAVSKAYRSVVAASKAVLVTEGSDSSVDAEILSEAQNRLVPSGILPSDYSRLVEEMQGMGSNIPSDDFTQKRIGYAQSYLQVCHSALEKIERDLKKKEAEKKAKAGTAKEEASIGPGTDSKASNFVRLDLSGVACPINYVKTKLKLEELEPGDLLEVILDEGEPIRNVPESVKNDGERIPCAHPPGAR